MSVWSSRAATVTAIIADRENPFDAVSIVSLRPDGDLWTAQVLAADVGDADLYGFRVDGPQGGTSRFDPAKLLLDPEAAEVWFPPGHDRDLARVRGADTLGRSPFGVLPMSLLRPPMPRGPRHSDNDLVICELHVRGATMRAPHVPLGVRGTFAGLAAHAPYLADIGFTAVELLPVHQYDPDEGNYWGYMPLAWNALHHRYVSGDDPDAEFRSMVHAFHDVGMEVILDVVYNHTTEEDDEGPTFNLRSIDDEAYYVLHPDGSYRDDAGCGNVLRAAHPAAAALVMGSLQRLADLGVDGFRFDLASLLGRDIDGQTQRDSEMIDTITAFAAERDVRLIAEPWDLTAYQVGDSFPGRTWAQWNGKFRDDARSFLRAENGAMPGFAARVLGSPDLYGTDAARSVNFVTAHDGFTLYDLVSYERKHNMVNGQGGWDGTDDNRSWNCGWEGDDPPAADADAIRALRLQQMKNAIVMLVLSAGTPMLVGGDEFAQTQHGNNNPYNQDNEITWLDWQRQGAYDELTEWVRTIIALRREHGDGSVALHGVGALADLGYSSHSLAWRRGSLYVIANAWWEPLRFEVQSRGPWTIAASSCAATSTLDGPYITLAPRSTVVLGPG